MCNFGNRFHYNYTQYLAGLFQQILLGSLATAMELQNWLLQMTDNLSVVTEILEGSNQALYAFSEIINSSAPAEIKSYSTATVKCALKST